MNDGTPIQPRPGRPSRRPKPTANPRFGHPAPVLADWRSRVRNAQQAGAVTPFFLFSPDPVSEALCRLEAEDFGRPTRHWLSTKTQPLPSLLNWWRQQDRPVEVVSELELCLALAAGFDPGSILVNGPAKHRWLPRHDLAGLRVNFDSRHELETLLPLARKARWKTGLRLNTSAEYDPEFPDLPTQFGLTPAEAAEAVRRLCRAGLPVETIHFHLRSNVAAPDCYGQALDEVATLVATTGIRPRHLDIGGGLPPPHVLSRAGRQMDAGMSLSALSLRIRQTVKRFPSVEEIWMENGRFVSAGSGVLVVRVQDIKERRGLRQLICDGGRTLHALVSIWEQHELLPLRRLRGPDVLTTVYGPTCMAFDQLARRAMPRSIRIGDYLIWFDAGAYHLPWENEFSHTRAEIWWHEGGSATCVRPPAAIVNPVGARRHTLRPPRSQTESVDGHAAG